MIRRKTNFKIHFGTAFLSLYLLLGCLLYAPTTVFAAPSAELWDVWVPSNSSSTEIIDHSSWDEFLRRYVVDAPDGINRVSYKTVTAKDRDHLVDYIDRLSKVGVTGLNRDSQLAYWVNLYNALTINVVLLHYPVKSIRDIDISPGFFSNGPWGKKLITVQGIELSLDDIEHRILRPIWQDPRLHYVLNCASIGCPEIGQTAMHNMSLDHYLDQAARRYINHPRAVNLKSGKLILSSIYDWYRDDFGNNDQELLDHLRQFATPVVLQRIGQDTPIKGYVYDWSLNE